MLVNRGWVPAWERAAPCARAIAVTGEERGDRGRTDSCRSAGMQLGTGWCWRRPIPWSPNFPAHAEIAAPVARSRWAAAADFVLLDPSEPDGYVRQWQPPGFPPVRHIAYAVQWFSLAAALAVIYFVTNVRRAGASA